MKVCPKCNKHFSDDANFCPVDAARLAPLEQAGASEQDSLGARFDLGERLGGATTGDVRRGTDKQGGGAVAVKLVSPAVMALPQIAQRIERELKQLERVDSGSVARVVASGKRGEQVWIATELVADAQTLAQAIRARGPLDAPAAAALIATIGEALIEAAKVGVVHRDLAPKNVLLAGGDLGRVKLINFCAPAPTSDRAPGVVEFVAPEVAEGKSLDQRSNIYSLGAIYYYALTGGAPVAGADGAFEPPSRKVTAVTADLDTLILRGLDRNPGKRYLTVRQFVDEIQRVARGEGMGTGRMARATGKQRNREAPSTLTGVPPAAPDGRPGRPGIGTDAPAAPSPAASPVVELTPKGPGPAQMPGTVVGMAPAPSGAGVLAPTLPVPVVTTSPGVAPAPVAHAPAHAPGGSPWAPPANAGPGEGAFAPAVAAQQAAAPAVGAVVAAAAPAAPIVPAAPVVPAQGGDRAAGGKTTKPPEDKAAKGKFRETMWFKKGDLDAAAAEAAAEEAERTGKATASDKADSLPMDERYKDDGSINRGDRDKYSLKTGDTTMMPAIKADDRSLAASVSEGELVGEMKGNRNTILLVGAVIAAVVIGAIIFFATR